MDSKALETLLTFTLGYKAELFMEKVSDNTSNRSDLEKVKQFISALQDSDWEIVDNKWINGPKDYWAGFPGDKKKAIEVLGFDLPVEELMELETSNGTISLMKLGDCLVIELDNSWDGGMEFIIL